MRRTQLYIDDAVLGMLKTIGRSKKMTISQLVRDAVQKVYGRIRAVDTQTALDASFGMWSERKEMSDTQKYIRSLRGARRAKRLKLT